MERFMNLAEYQKGNCDYGYLKEGSNELEFTIFGYVSDDSIG
jgi:hypothetical protein